jgi:SLT domain-containing protein
MPQALPFSKMPKAAWPPSAGGTANPRAQLGWMFDYIGGRYGTPDAAWAHEQAYHWYANGGHMRPGEIGVVGENGPELVRAGQQGATVTTGAQVVNHNTFKLEFHGPRPTNEEWHAIQLKLAAAVGSN